jgi:hypothetical protein
LVVDLRKEQVFPSVERALEPAGPLHEVDEIERMFGHHREDVLLIGDERTYQNRIELRVSHLDVDLRGVFRIIADDEAGTAVSDPEWVRLEGGFQPGLVYDLMYVPRDCPVVGAGLIAMRDLAAFLRRHPASPLAGKVDHVIGEGISQCGRLMRTFLGLGLNTAEDGGPSYDGLLIHVAGGRRGEFNMRYGQPSVQPTPAFGHRSNASPAGLVECSRIGCYGSSRERRRGTISKPSWRSSIARDCWGF